MSDIVANRGSELSVSSLGGSIARAVSAAIAAAHRVVSIGYLFLRATTALGALFAGLVQTFVFARVLTPAQFAVFVLLASFGVSLALLDFGVVKLFFVRLRAAYLAGRIPTAIAAQATAIVALYALIVTVCVLLCVAVFALLPTVSPRAALQFTLFFLFAALNFVWFALRNISVAIDEFIFFEALEATRRVGNIALTVAMLFGLPLLAFLAAINLLWAVLLVLSIMRLVQRRAMLMRLQRVRHNLLAFYRGNRTALLGSGVYATTEIYVYAFPYIVVSAFFGLGAPTIILDTTLKILRGASLLYAAACDLMVPRQTRAFADRDAATLMKVTWLAALFCALPAVALSAMLLVSADWMFAALLGPAAVMPAAAAPILVAMLLANLTQMVAHSLLVHTGFFKQIAKLGLVIAAAMTAATAVAVASGADIVGFLKVYTGVYACGALISVVLVLRGPMRAAKARPVPRPVRRRKSA